MTHPDAARSADEYLRALRDRLEEAERALNDRESTHRVESPEAIRLAGKVQGVRLAMSYLDEMMRRRPSVGLDDDPDAAVIQRIAEVMTNAYVAGEDEAVAPTTEDLDLARHILEIAREVSA